MKDRHAEKRDIKLNQLLTSTQLKKILSQKLKKKNLKDFNLLQRYDFNRMLEKLAFSSLIGAIRFNFNNQIDIKLKHFF